MESDMERIFYALCSREFQLKRNAVEAIRRGLGKAIHATRAKIDIGDSAKEDSKDGEGFGKTEKFAELLQRLHLDQSSSRKGTCCIKSSDKLERRNLSPLSRNFAERRARN